MAFSVIKRAGSWKKKPWKQKKKKTRRPHYSLLTLIWDGVRCQWQAVLVKVSRQGSKKRSQLASLCRTGGHALTLNMKRELRWKKGQESNTEKREEPDTQDCKGSASQENKTRYQSSTQEVEKALEELNFSGKTSTCDCTFMHVCLYCRACNIYTLTHVSHGIAQCLIFTQGRWLFTWSTATKLSHLYWH